jgi:hypothetical protein
LGVLAGLLHGGHAGPQVADVIQRVKNSENIDPVRRALLHEALDDAVFVVPVAQQVLPAQKHLQAALGHQFAKGAQTLPGVFIQKADAGVIRRPAPALHRPVAGIVNLFADRNHVVQAHTGGQQTLVCITKRKFCNLNHAGHGQLPKK